MPTIFQPYAHFFLPVRYFRIKSLRQLAAAIPHADLYNLYGPTETNVCTYYKVQANDLVRFGQSPCLLELLVRTQRFLRSMNGSSL